MRCLIELGPEEYRYELRVSKNNPEGAPLASNFKPVVGKAARALREWLEAAGIRDGRIFRRVRADGRHDEPLSAKAVRAIVRRRSSQAKVQGRISAHSLRSGFVTEPSERDMAVGTLMHLSGHRSVQSLVGYCRPDSVPQAARDLLE